MRAIDGARTDRAGASLTTSTQQPTADPLDAIILAAADGEWCKVAVFMSKVMDAAKAQSIETTGQAIAARIYVLCEQGQLEPQGNVRRWRAASVRRKGETPAG